LASGAGEHDLRSRGFVRGGGRSEANSPPEVCRWRVVGAGPANIDFSGDAGNIVIRLRWSAWGQSRAVGVGSSNILSCIPNCAQGKATLVSTRITLSRPRAGHFTKIVELRAGQRYVAYYGRASWPAGAS
jgi:hypothetical protein